MTAIPRNNTENKRQYARQYKQAGKIVLLMMYDYFVIHLAYFLALWGRFDFVFSAIPEKYFEAYTVFITFYAVGCLVFFWFLRMYHSLLRFASYTELSRVLFCSLVCSVTHAVLITVCVRRMPISYYLSGAVIQFCLLAVGRFGYRMLLFLQNRWNKDSEITSRVMLIGAGSAGQMILRDIMHNESSKDRVVCIIDDDAQKWNLYIDGICIVGGRDEILSNVEKYNINKIFFAIPSISASEKREILHICNETGCEVKSLPGIYQLISGKVSVGDLKSISVEDLLGRDPIHTDMSEVFRLINDKVILVTGGGGSIGSELCRQIASHSPRQLIILDIYENNAYDIQLELKEKYPNLDLKVLIGSVRDSRRMFEVFSRYRPQIVYHAAAHKHVPLMEESPCEAIKNNPIGTYKTAYAAMVHGCERFVLISTDKAVNPTNIMGASKRLCEMIIQSFDTMIRAGRAQDIPQLFTHNGVENADKTGDGSVFKTCKTEFVAVRFGNVLGSNGSVVPIFKKQIAKGGPVTVTHPDIIRYFMTISEAVSLVMLAGTYAHGGEIFVLDMGSPVKIDTLARNLIRLVGLRPDIDIPIEYTGLRAGEKLYEEKLMAEEGLKKTENELIHIGQPIPFDTEKFLSSLRSLMEETYSNNEQIRQIVMDIVPTYHPELGGKSAEATGMGTEMQTEKTDDEKVAALAL